MVGKCHKYCYYNGSTMNLKDPHADCVRRVKYLIKI